MDSLLGAWVGQAVFGGLRQALWARRSSPAIAVQVVVPEAARDLLSRPFELARFADGTSFREAGVRFVYGLDEGTTARAVAKEPARNCLRILAAFSLPAGANPLNLRRERHGLQRLVRELNQTRGLAVELRVLQYGATRETLREALEEAEGWDIIQLSGHGRKGELLLEDGRGGSDTIGADELGGLLNLSGARLKLLILDACYSGVLGQSAARAQVGLERPAMRHEGADLTGAAETELPGLAQALSQRLDCAALAMRYPVGDDFATDLMLALYEKLLEKRHALPAALHLALDEALTSGIPRPPLSPITPVLVGIRAAELQLTPPRREAEAFVLPRVGLGIGFPTEPGRFVGRVQPMLRAGQSLARRSAMRGVLFYGMPGAGKTACALELAYRHERGRFEGHVWHRAPEDGNVISTALFDLMQDIQTQLDAPDLGLTTALDQPDQFRRFTLPRLRDLLKQRSLLLVLDNLETLLADSGRWRDPLWGDVVASFLSHDGPSRVVLTSRRVPTDLADHAKVQSEAIHALSLPESVLLARELPNLRALFDDEAGRALLRQTLRVAQGHPKLLELADGLATDRLALAARVASAENELRDRGDVLDAFFAVGVALEGESRQGDDDFVQALQRWTTGIAGTLTPTARLLLTFLCRLEPADRNQGLVRAAWPGFLKRVSEGNPDIAAAMAEPDHGLPTALAELRCGLVEVEHPVLDPKQIEAQKTLRANQTYQSGEVAPGTPHGPESTCTTLAATYTIHPGIAEAVGAAADPTVFDAADVELGDYHLAVHQRAFKSETESGGLIVYSARHAAPYLLRRKRWDEASILLDWMLLWDGTPANLGFALPLLLRIVEATTHTDEDLEHTGVLAKTLAKMGNIAEAEPILRNVIARSIAQDNYRLASVSTSDLLYLLVQSGRLAEAMKETEQQADYTIRAGLGPWTRLGAATWRLHVLAAMGRNDEVLAALEALRPHMDALPMETDASEVVRPWNIRETLLDIGREAASNTERWETALAFNNELVEAKLARGASELEISRTRFNDSAALLRLSRYDKTRELLLSCRAAFEAARHTRMLGKVYGALADLEHHTGDSAAAVRFEEVALNYKYMAGKPDACASSHLNLASFLERQGIDPATILAHRLAAAVIWLRTGSGSLRYALNNLANSEPPPTAPTFAEITRSIEEIDGVHFRELFETFPGSSLDGDAAIATIWQMVEGERRRRKDHMTHVLQQLEPVLQRIAAAAEDESRRAQREPALALLEKKGFRLSDAVHRIWSGDRDAMVLTAGLDEQESVLIRRVLNILDH